MNLLERLRNLLQPKKRDLMMGMVWEGVWSHFSEMNKNAGNEYGDYDPNLYQFFQELYVASGGGIFALSVQGGKLYRSAVTVTDAGVMVGMPEQIVMRFEPLQRTRIVTRLDNGLPVFLSILATAALNKANELDTRALFDDFISRFTGETEYMNVYHLDNDKSRIGKLLWIGRDENLLLGLWTPDDNIVGRAVAETLAADEKGEWGVSIEFLSDDEGYLVEVVPGIELRAFAKGELWGASVVRSAHACSWFTGHTKERVFTMNKEVKQAIETLIQDPDALKEFETWVDGANRTIKDSGAITRADAACTCDTELTARADGCPDSAKLSVQVASLAETVTALSTQVAGIVNVEATELSTENQTIEIGPEAAQGIAEAVFSGEAFRSLADGVARLSGALEAQSKQTLDAVQALTDRVVKLETTATERISKLERTDEDKLRDHDEMKPRGSNVTVAWRPSRGKEDKPTNGKTMTLAQMARKTTEAWEK